MYIKRLMLLAYLLSSMTSSIVTGFPNPVPYIRKIVSIVRSKRSAPDFHAQLTCYQPDIIVLSTYGNYGCFCGFSGSGRPIDATDRCCMEHDECYKKLDVVPKTYWESVVGAMTMGGTHLLLPYGYKCEEGAVSCENNSAYKDKLCDCDRKAAICLHEASSTYHPQLYEIDTAKYCTNDADHSDLNLTSFGDKRTDRPVKQKQLNTQLATRAEHSITSSSSAQQPNNTTADPGLHVVTIAPLEKRDPSEIAYETVRTESNEAVSLPSSTDSPRSASAEQAVRTRGDCDVKSDVKLEVAGSVPTSAPIPRSESGNSAAAVASETSLLTCAFCTLIYSTIND